VAELTGETLRLYDTDKAILENNIYGVDINEESVEIAKLSLWLRTAQRGRPLSDLSGNIKCGNSLIDDPEVAGDKAFNWEKEYPHVFNPEIKEKVYQKFPETKPDYLNLIKKGTKEAQKKAKKSAKLSKEAVEISQKVYEYAEKLGVVSESETIYGLNKGGFDVVLGNPPYFPISTLDKQSLKFLKGNYINADKSGDIYCLFYELGINILKPDGLISFITSNQWLQAQYGKVLRDYFIKKTNPEKLINFGGVKIFKDATVDSSIFTSRKTNCKFNLKACIFPNSFIGEDISAFISLNSLQVKNLEADKWFIVEDNINELRERIKTNNSILKNHNVKIFRGILTGFNEAFIIDTEKKEELCKNNPENLEIIKPLLRGRDIHRYNKNWAELWLITTLPSMNLVIDDFPIIRNYFQSFGKRLEQTGEKGSRKKTNNKWFETQDTISYYQKIFEEKIIYPETTVRRAEFYRDTEGFYIDKTAFMIVGENLGYYQAILASKLMQWYLEFDLRSLGKNSIQYSKIFIEKTPIPKLSESIVNEFNNKSNNILKYDKQISQKKNKFIKRIKSNLEIAKITNKLNNFYDFDFKTFVSELKKQKIKLSLRQQDEWEDYFDNYKTEINDLQNQINKTDSEIDKMVYELYKLTEEEIKIVENSVK